MQRRAFLAFVMLAFLVAWPLRAQRVTPTGTLVVRVKKVDGTPQGGARVYVQPGDGRTPHTAQTDATGHFKFEKVRVGLYDLRAQAGGLWSDLQQNVNVKADQVVNVELQLKPANSSKSKNP